MCSYRKRFACDCRKGLAGLFIFLICGFGCGGVCLSQTGTTRVEVATNDFRPLEIFENVWLSVDEHFYREDFNGVDWKGTGDEFRQQAAGAADLVELSTVINQMLRRLDTSHTAFYTKHDIEYFHLLDIFASGSMGAEILQRFPDQKIVYPGVGFFVRKTEQDWFIEGVMEGGPADNSGLHRGQQILSVNGNPFRPVDSFEGLVGTRVRIVVQSTPESDSCKEVELEVIEIEPQAFLLETLKNSMKIIEHAGKKIAYARFWSYAGREFQNEFEQELLAGRLKDADSLIMDVRDGWGGANPEYLNLFNHRVPRMSSYRRGETKMTYFNTQWRKPVCLLVNGGSRSGKEILAYGFRKYDIGPVVGSRTAGAVAGGTPILVGDDCVLYLAVMGVEVDGEVLEGKGVEPDHPVDAPLKYAPPIDVQLQAAVEVIAR